jgi:5-methylcytosine-specific restriction endonuclease McrA
MRDGIRFLVAHHQLTYRSPTRDRYGTCKFCDLPVGGQRLFCDRCLPERSEVDRIDYTRTYNLLYRACGFIDGAGRPSCRLSWPKPAPVAKPKTVAVCELCGASFEKLQLKQRFCNRSCNKAAGKRRARARNNPNYRSIGVCAYCSVGCKGFVCDSCKEKNRSVARRKTRKRLDGVEWEHYTPTEIAERDGWRCQLCRKAVNSRKRWPDPMCASIDHIVPITKGGTDVRANVQLAHLRCNISKGNRLRPDGEQLRLLG